MQEHFPGNLKNKKKIKKELCNGRRRVCSSEEAEFDTSPVQHFN